MGVNLAVCVHFARGATLTPRAWCAPLRVCWLQEESAKKPAKTSFWSKQGFSKTPRGADGSSPAAARSPACAGARPPPPSLRPGRSDCRRRRLTTRHIHTRTRTYTNKV